MALFDRGPLPQDDGRIKERWNQDDTTYVNATDAYSFGTPSDQLIHTVTTNKKFYCKEIIYSGGTTVTCTLKDNATAVAEFIFTNAGDHIILNIPLKFETSAKWNCSGGDNTIYLIGWEE